MRDQNKPGGGGGTEGAGMDEERKNRWRTRHLQHGLYGASDNRAPTHFLPVVTFSYTVTGTLVPRLTSKTGANSGCSAGCSTWMMSQMRLCQAGDTAINSDGEAASLSEDVQLYHDQRPEWGGEGAVIIKGDQRKKNKTWRKKGEEEARVPP